MSNSLIVILVVGAILIIGLGIIVILPSKRSRTVEIDFDIPAETLWEVFTDPASQANWRDSVKQVVMVKPDYPRIWLETPDSGPDIQFTETEVVPGQRLVLTFAATGYFEGDYEAVFEPTESGTKGRFTERVRPANLISKAFSYAFFDLEKEITRYAGDAEMEARRRLGEVAPTHL